MGGGFGGEWMHVYGMSEFLCCSPETTTTLLIGYTPIQNKKFKVFKKQQQQQKVVVTKGEMWRGGIN